jgi:hypothetical protein
MPKGPGDNISNKRNPILILKQAFTDIEKGQTPLEILAINTILEKDPLDYSQNAFQRLTSSQ